MNMRWKSDKFNSLSLSAIWVNWRPNGAGPEGHCPPALQSCPPAARTRLGSPSSLLPFPSNEPLSEWQPLPLSLILHWFQFTLVFLNPTSNCNSYQPLKICILINDLEKNLSLLQKRHGFHKQTQYRKKWLLLPQGQGFPTFLSNFT